MVENHFQNESGRDEALEAALISGTRTDSVALIAERLKRMPQQIFDAIRHELPQKIQEGKDYRDLAAAMDYLAQVQSGEKDMLSMLKQAAADTNLLKRAAQQMQTASEYAPYARLLWSFLGAAEDVSKHMQAGSLDQELERRRQAKEAAEIARIKFNLDSPQRKVG